MNKAAQMHAVIIPVMGGIYLIFLTIRMVSEKKNHMIDYLRTMGLLESANIWGYFFIYAAYSIFPALVYEISGRLLRITFVQKAAVGVVVFSFPDGQIPTLWFFLYLVGMTMVAIWVSFRRFSFLHA